MSNVKIIFSFEICKCLTKHTSIKKNYANQKVSVKMNIIKRSMNNK